MLPHSSRVGRLPGAVPPVPVLPVPGHSPGTPLILHPQPQASPTVPGKAQSPHTVLQKLFLVASLKSPQTRAEESSSSSGIRYQGVKQETGSKSSSSSLSCLLHNWVPPGWSLCLTLSLCHPSPVSLCQVTAGARQGGGSSVGSQSWCYFLGTFGLFCHPGHCREPRLQVQRQEEKMRRRKRTRRRRKVGTGAASPRGILMFDPPILLGSLWNYTRAGGEALPAPPALGPAGAPGASHPKFLQDGAAGPSSRTDFHILLPACAQLLSPQPSSPRSPCPGFSLSFLSTRLAQALLPCAKVNTAMATAPW